MKEKIEELKKLLNKYTIEDVQILSIIDQFGLNVMSSETNEAGVEIQTVANVSIEKINEEDKNQILKEYEANLFDQNQISLIKSHIEEINNFDREYYLTVAKNEITNLLNQVEQKNLKNKIEQIGFGFKDNDEFLWVHFMSKSKNTFNEELKMECKFNFNTIAKYQENYDPDLILDEILEFSVDQSEDDFGEEYGLIFDQIYTLRVFEILKSALNNSEIKLKIRSLFGNELEIITWLYPVMQEFILLEAEKG